MEHFMEEYGAMIMAVLGGGFVMGFVMNLITRNEICSYILENCLRAF